MREYCLMKLVKESISFERYKDPKKTLFPHHKEDIEKILKDIELVSHERMKINTTLKNKINRIVNLSMRLDPIEDRFYLKMEYIPKSFIKFKEDIKNLLPYIDLIKVPTSKTDKYHQNDFLLRIKSIFVDDFKPYFSSHLGFEIRKIFVFNDEIYTYRDINNDFAL